jgi:hypothetical protein
MGGNGRQVAEMPGPLPVMEAVAKAARETLENMVFSEPEPVGSVGALSDPVLGVALRVTSPLDLKIVMVMPEELARRIGAIIFRHEEDGDSTEAIRDAASEVLNTLAGKIMRELIPGDQLFLMGFPSPWRPGDEGGRPADLQCPFMVEGLPLRILLYGEIDFR